MAKHTSYRGQVIDMELLKFQNQNSVALGNAQLNARGDKIGKGGTVLKTREDMLKEQDREHGIVDITPDNITASIHPEMQELDQEFDKPIAAAGADFTVEPTEPKRKPRTSRSKDE